MRAAMSPEEGSPGAGEAEALGVEAHLAALSSLAGMGPARLERLLGRWGPEEAWEVLVAGSLTEVTGVARVGEQVGRRWISDARRADSRRDPPAPPECGGDRAATRRRRLSRTPRG